MAKTKINYVCTQCGAVQPKWMGKCPDCGSWNTLVEQMDQPVSRFASAPAAQAVSCTVQTLEQIDSTEEQRYLTRMQELNRVLVRVKEAQRLGFRRCILPKQCVDAITADVDIQLIGVSNLAQAIQQLG